MIRRPTRRDLTATHRFAVRAILGHATTLTTVCTRPCVPTAADALASTISIPSCSLAFILDTDTGREISLSEARGE